MGFIFLWSTKLTEFFIITRLFKRIISFVSGILDNVQYIKELGVDAVWLNPIYPTEDVDFGYDITDMKNIYSLLGNMSVFEELVTKLHQEGDYWYLKIF